MNFDTNMDPALLRQNLIHWSRDRISEDPDSDAGMFAVGLLALCQRFDFDVTLSDSSEIFDHKITHSDFVEAPYSETEVANATRLFNKLRRSKITSLHQCIALVEFSESRSVQSKRSQYQVLPLRNYGEKSHEMLTRYVEQSILKSLNEEDENSQTQTGKTKYSRVKSALESIQRFVKNEDVNPEIRFTFIQNGITSLDQLAQIYKNDRQKYARVKSQISHDFRNSMYYFTSKAEATTEFVKLFTQAEKLADIA